MANELHCPSHPESPTYWALFICDDGVFRCRACRDKRPVPVAVPVSHKPKGVEGERPYITRRSARK